LAGAVGAGAAAGAQAVITTDRMSPRLSACRTDRLVAIVGRLLVETTGRRHGSLVADGDIRRADPGAQTRPPRGRLRVRAS
jgi:hypothetical protein